MTKEKRSQRSHSSGTLIDHEVLFQIPQQSSIVSSVLRSGIKCQGSEILLDFLEFQEQPVPLLEIRLKLEFGVGNMTAHTP